MDGYRVLAAGAGINVFHRVRKRRHVQVVPLCHIRNTITYLTGTVKVGDPGLTNADSIHMAGNFYYDRRLRWIPLYWIAFTMASGNMPIPPIPTFSTDSMIATEGETEDSLDNYLSSARSDTTLFSLYFDSSLYWDAGHIVYVPLAADIQTYVTAADSGTTLILASGTYTITSTITISKPINIVGQGCAGFFTTPIILPHGTLITSSTASVTAFQINANNVRISGISINLTGAASKAINTRNRLDGLVFSGVDIIVNSTGATQGGTVLSSNVVLRDVTFYITSSDAAASGIWFWNNSSSAQNAVMQCINVSGTVSGVSGSSYAFVCQNLNDANTLTMTLSNSVAKAVAGAGTDVALASISTATYNSTINAYFCTLDGAEWDAYQTGSNVLNLHGSALVNNLVSGTVVYRVTMAAQGAVFGGLTLGPGSITDTSGTINFGNENLTLTAPLTARTYRPWA